MGQTWTIVLAAGDGTRLSALTTNHRGVSVPKQFCSLDGGPSLLQAALERGLAIAEPDRRLVVVAAHHRRWWRRELVALPAGNRIVQPQNRGTAVGALLPLLEALERDAEARVVLLPSDHHVENEPALGAAIGRALDAVARRPESVVLLGITPDAPDSDYGWILPRAVAGAVEAAGPEPVATFLEKPPREIAAGLMARGGLWNSFVIVAGGQALIRLYRRRLPGLVEGLGAARRSASRRGLAAFYETLSPADFSRDLLQGSEGDLHVLAAPPCGWSDLGTPERVVTCVERLAGVTPEPTRRPGTAPPIVLSRACRIGILAEA